MTFQRVAGGDITKTLPHKRIVGDPLSGDKTQTGLAYDTAINDPYLMEPQKVPTSPQPSCLLPL